MSIDDLLESRWGEESTSIFGPRSVQEIRDRLKLISETPCRCHDTPHENALHDLAEDDVPALLDIIEKLIERNT